MNIRFKRKHLLIWTVICSIAAMPSFTFSLETNPNFAAIALGVALFIVLYTLASSSVFFDKIHANDIWRKALKFGFGIRVLQSLFFFCAGPIAWFGLSSPGAMAAVVSMPALLLEGFPGILSLAAAFRLIHGSVPGAGTGSASMMLNGDFAVTFLATLFQGVLLNLVVLGTVLIAAFFIYLWSLTKRRLRPAL